MLASLEANAAGLGLDVSTEVSDAELLPFADRSFDLVFGHAVLHHIPDLERAFAELHRVLRPGGALAFCGEPSRHGDRLAALPKRAGQAAGARLALGARGRARRRRPRSVRGQRARAGERGGRARLLPRASCARRLRRAGFEASAVRGEELLANIWGWGLRSVEASAEPDTVPIAWRRFAFRSYLALQRLDESLLEPRLPPQLFYNLVLSARKPRVAFGNARVSRR